MAPFAPMVRAGELFHLVRRAACLLACAAVLVGTAEARLKDYPFRIETVKSPGQHEIIAHNEGPATMTVYLTIEGQNVASDVAWPITRAIPAYTSMNLAKLFPDDPKKKITSSYTVSRQYGDFRAVHAEVNYRLPYQQGSAFRITQAYGDPLTSHLGHHSQHAVDFAMPEGTPVVAARDGVVIDVTLDYEAGGVQLDLRDKANAIAILHDDGTVAYYAHLAKRGGSTVKLGERVKAGVVIGYSGNTGYSSGPHLHFAVMKPEVPADGRVAHVALPVKFYVDTWTLPFEPRRGALITASYSAEAGRRVAQAPAPEPQGMLSHEPVSASLIPVKTFPTAPLPQPAAPAGQVMSAAESAAPVQAASAAFEQTGVVQMRRAALESLPAAPLATSPAQVQVFGEKANTSTRAADDEGWSVVELMLIALSSALVLLFAGYFRGRTTLAR